MNSEVHELQQVLASGSRNPNGWCIIDSETASRLNLLIERLVDRAEEATNVAVTLALAVKVNLEEMNRMPGVSGAVKKFDNFMFGDSND